MLAARLAAASFVLKKRAVELNAPISTGDFRTLNRCLDAAIAGAVTGYGRERNQSGIDGESARGSERLGFFAHELRNLMNTASMAFEVLKSASRTGVQRRPPGRHLQQLKERRSRTCSLYLERFGPRCLRPEP